jgi:hypothetical protein
MAALSTIHDVTGGRLVSSIYSWDIYGQAAPPSGGGLQNPRKDPAHSGAPQEKEKCDKIPSPAWTQEEIYG